MTLFCRTVMSATLIMPSEFTSPEPLGLHPSVRMAPVQISLTPGQQSPAIAHTTESQPQPLDVYSPQSVAVHAGAVTLHLLRHMLEREPVLGKRNRAQLAVTL